MDGSRLVQVVMLVGLLLTFAMGHAAAEPQGGPPEGRAKGDGPGDAPGRPAAAPETGRGGGSVTTAHAAARGGQQGGAAAAEPQSDAGTVRAPAAPGSSTPPGQAPPPEPPRHGLAEPPTDARVEPPTIPPPTSPSDPATERPTEPPTEPPTEAPDVPAGDPPGGKEGDADARDDAEAKDRPDGAAENGAEQAPDNEQDVTRPAERAPALPVALFLVETFGPLVLVDAAEAFAPEGSLTRFHWDWGDGEETWGSDLEIHEYADPFVAHTITLTVYDQAGEQASRRVTVLPAEDPIEADLVVHLADGGLVADGSGSTAGAFLLTTWTWDWGDGTTPGDGVMAEHHYASPGTYTIRLTVEDETGRSATQDETVHVRDGSSDSKTGRSMQGASTGAEYGLASGPSPMVLFGLVLLLGRRRA